MDLFYYSALSDANIKRSNEYAPKNLTCNYNCNRIVMIGIRITITHNIPPINVTIEPQH